MWGTSCWVEFWGYNGNNSAVTEEYDGATWSTGGNLATARKALAGCGTQAAGLSFGGYTDTYSAITEEYAELLIFISWIGEYM